VVTIGGTTVTLVNNGDGTYSFQVPAGTTGGIVVTVPTTTTPSSKAARS
jgi:hypothetical protein